LIRVWFLADCVACMLTTELLAEVASYLSGVGSFKETKAYSGPNKLIITNQHKKKHWYRRRILR